MCHVSSNLHRYCGVDGRRLVVVPASADVIYYDSFTRGTPDEPMLLNYSEPEVRSGTLGGSDYARWFSFIPGEGLPWATLGENAQLGYSGFRHLHSGQLAAVQATEWLRLHLLDDNGCIYNPGGGNTQLACHGLLERSGRWRDGVV